MNQELPDVQVGFRKGTGTRDQIASICWTIEKAREFQENIYFCFIDFAKAFDCVDHSKQWKILRDRNTRPVYLPPTSQFSLVAQLCLNLCNSMDSCMPGFPIHHQLLELAQTHVHLVGDAIWPSHPLLSPSPPAFNLSQNQGLFQWVSSSHQVAKGLEFQL